MSTYKKCYESLLIRFSILLVASCILSGCSTTLVTLKPEINRPSGVTQIPLTVGVYYDTAFRSYEHSFILMRTCFDFSLGKDSVVLFDNIFPIVFERAVPVISRPPLTPGGPGVAAVIEPKIEEFKVIHPWGLVGDYSVDITYRFTLYNPEGDQIVSSTFMGQGEKYSYLGGFSPRQAPGEATSFAMQEAAEKFMSGFPCLPKVRQWIMQAGGADTR